MAGLTYVGPTPTAARDIETRTDVESRLDQGVSRSYVDGRVAELIGQSRATKVYVDTQDEQYAESNYYTTQDALLVPLTAKGAVNGVATYDSSSKIIASQVPVLGAGILRGPYGHAQAFGGSGDGTPFKIAQWNIGQTGVTGQILVFFQTSVLTEGSRPIIEIRAGLNTQTAYADQTLVGRGFGRSSYTDYQYVSAVPATTDGKGQDGQQTAWLSTDNLALSAWLFTDDGGPWTTTNSSITTAAVYIARTVL